MVDAFAGFLRGEIHGWPVLACRDARFKTFRLALLLQRPLDQAQAARAILPALLQHGTRAWPDRPALARASEELYGAHVGAAVGRHGESSMLSLSADAVAGDFLPERPEQFRSALELLGEYALRPRLDAAGAIPAEVFVRERAQALAAARALIDDKAAYARLRAVQCACAGEPYAVPDHGGEAAIAALDAAQPAAMLRDYVQHGRRLCVAIGVLPEDLPAALGPMLAELAAVGQSAAIPAPVQVARRAPGRTHETAEMQQAKLVLVFRAPRPTEPDALCALQACLGLWGGGPHSRLFREVRERRSLCYYAAAGGDVNKGLLQVQVGCEGAAVAAVTEETLRQLEELAAGRFDDAELATTLATIDGSLRAVDDSLAGRLHFTVEQYLRGFDEDPPARRRRFARITREAVAAAAQSIWLDHEYALLPGARAEAMR